MDISSLRSIAVRLRHSLQRVGVSVDGVILFGSHARNQDHQASDIDIAVLSRDFGRDRFNEGVLVNIHATRIHPDLEAIPVALRDWFDPFPNSPILHEIQKDGIFLI